jgi:hypothetical protein
VSSDTLIFPPRGALRSIDPTPLLLRPLLHALLETPREPPLVLFEALAVPDLWPGTDLGVFGGFGVVGDIAGALSSRARWV